MVTYMQYYAQFVEQIWNISCMISQLIKHLVE